MAPPRIFRTIYSIGISKTGVLIRSPFIGKMLMLIFKFLTVFEYNGLCFNIFVSRLLSVRTVYSIHFYLFNQYCVTYVYVSDVIIAPFECIAHFCYKIRLKNYAMCHTEKNNSHFSTKNVVNIINLWLFWYQPQT